MELILSMSLGIGSRRESCFTYDEVIAALPLNSLMHDYETYSLMWVYEEILSQTSELFEFNYFHAKL